MKLKKYKKKTVGFYFSREIIIIILAIIFSLLIINYFSYKFNKVVMPIAVSSTRKYITVVINEATDGVKLDGNLFSIEKSSDNEIKMITYNSYEATKLINEITNNIQDKLNYNNKYYNSIISEIPLGVIFKNSLLKNFGPRIKVKSDIIGDVISELQTEVKPYGINNALVEVKVKIDASANVILPLVSKEIKIINMIPISINIVNGSVPEAYFYTYK